MSRENQIATAVMKIAASQKSGIATFKRCYVEVPHHLKLSAAETSLSATRPGEPMWHQLVRNIRCHHDADGNFIDRGLLEHVPKVGYRITNAGRQSLTKKP
ncbi:MAG TPA: hypothetical protein VF680_07740 [Allosphingosinicella sp.]|jgi:hypothetical protein